MIIYFFNKHWQRLCLSDSKKITFVLNRLTDQKKWKKKKEEDEYIPDDDLNDISEFEGVPEAAKADTSKLAEGATEDEFGAKDYRSQMELKPDHASRALWVVSFLFVYTNFRLKIFLFTNFHMFYFIFRHLTEQFISNLSRQFTNTRMIF